MEDAGIEGDGGQLGEQNAAMEEEEGHEGVFGIICEVQCTVGRDHLGVES